MTELEQGFSGGQFDSRKILEEKRFSFRKGSSAVLEIWFLYKKYILTPSQCHMVLQIFKLNLCDTVGKVTVYLKAYRHLFERLLKLLCGCERPAYERK